MVVEVGLTTFAEYAKHRGESRASITMAVKRGKLTRSVVTAEDGSRLIDVEMADIEWRRNTDPSRGPRKKKTIEAKKPKAVLPAKAAEQKEVVKKPVLSEGPEIGRRFADVDPARQMIAPPTGIDYNDARAEREWADAQLKLIELYKETQKVALIEPMVKAVVQMHSAAVASMRNLPSRLSSKLASINDPVDVEIAISDEIELIVSEMNRKAKELHGIG